MTDWRVIQGDAREVLRALPDESVQMCITSPPYWGLRDYGTEGQIGLERTPEEYTAKLVEIFREVRRVLRKDGTLWLNLGDCYATGPGRVGERPGGGSQGDGWQGPMTQPNRMPLSGLKPKDLVGVPWRVAFALQADGWWLRSAITWCKVAPMPESVRDRPTSATEMVFMLTKSATYFYDNLSVAEPTTWNGQNRYADPSTHAHNLDGLKPGAPGNNFHQPGRDEPQPTRNMRNYWLLGPEPFPAAHFAVFPTELAKRCILAGTSARGACPRCGAPWRREVERRSENLSNAARAGTNIVGKGHPTSQVRDLHDVRNGPTPLIKTVGWSPSCACDASEPVPQTVLDPFCGAGTAGLVAHRLGRAFIGIELNPTYVELARRRIYDDAPLLMEAQL